MYQEKIDSKFVTPEEFARMADIGRKLRGRESDVKVALVTVEEGSMPDLVILALDKQPFAVFVSGHRFEGADFKVVEEAVKEAMEDELQDISVLDQWFGDDISKYIDKIKEPPMHMVFTSEPSLSYYDYEKPIKQYTPPRPHQRKKKFPFS